MFLFIDMTPEKGFGLALGKPEATGPLFLMREGFDAPAEDLLGIIDKFFKKNKVLVAELAGIALAGGRSFTQTRTAASVANTIGFFMDIPVAVITAPDVTEGVRALRGKSGFVPARPVYSAKPNITRPKSRKLKIKHRP
ncbi:MAG: hypothetical protein PHW53_02770 [Patescibacteria group bacterium]|nr:hypothetical protein [Patescibacteria group bacterium]